MFGYIYKTTNLINNKQYIGQHKSEVFEPEKYIGSGTYLLRAIKKYGINNFKCELLECCDSREELNEREIYWISFFNAVEDKNFYNFDRGGKNGRVISGKDNPMWHKTHTLEAREKISKANKGKTITPEQKEKIKQTKLKKGSWGKCWNRGIKGYKKPLTEKGRESLKKSFIAKRGVKLKLSDKERERRRKACIINLQSKETIEKVHIKLRGKRRPYMDGDNNPSKREDVRKKISEKLKGRSVSLETRQKIRETLIKYNQMKKERK